jgi:L-rhamnose mutarotase
LIRKGFVMSVFPEHAAEYRRRHNPIWEELEAKLKDHGVASYSIFMHPQTHVLFGYIEIESEQQWSAVADTEICRKWWAHMRELMPSNPDNSPVSIDLEEVFHIEK